MKFIIPKEHVTHYCDFCGKSDREVQAMIDGKHAFICDECVDEARLLIRPKIALVK